MRPALIAAMTLSLVGCPSVEEPALVGIEIAAQSAQSDTFDTAGGYEVTLSHGVVALGELHFHEPARRTAKDVEEQALRLPLSGLLGPATAHAHPGHDMSGDVRGELGGTFVVDLLAPAAILGEASFYEGPYETASLLLQLGDGPTASLAGVASDGVDSIPFEFTVDHAKTVLGIPFEAEVDAAAPPEISLVVDPAEILGHLDFLSLDSDGDGVVTEGDDGVVNPLLFGLESNLVYRYEID